MSSEHIGVLITFGFYLVLLVVIGRLGEKKHARSYEDFVSADKSLGALVTAISAASSSESVWVMLGLSGLGFWKGAAALWAALGCVIGFVFNAVFVTVQLRRESDRLDSVTVSDYIEARLGDESGVLRLVSALIITFFMLSYVVAQFTGAGDLFHGMELLGPDTPYWLGVVVGAFIIALYIVLGGYAAVCWTDTVQGLLMFVVMLGLPIAATVMAGGLGGIAAVLGPLGLMSMSGPEAAGWAAVGFVVGQLGISIGYPGMPHMIVRYMTVVDDKAARRAAWISVVWSCVVLFGSTLLGMAVRALSPELADTQKEAEQLVIPYFCRLALPPLLTGVVISAVTAAIMSTADSQLMYAATSLINDLWLKRRDKPPLPAKQLVRITRVVLLVMTVVAMVVALLKIRLIYTFVLFAWGALGSAFTPIIVLSLYWRKLTRQGALASLIVGPSVIVIWYNVTALHEAVYELIPAFVLSLISAVVVSLVTYRGEAGSVSLPGGAGESEPPRKEEA
ncbi:MAG: sodium/proline symporter [Deltaproteobacteria bacterium]|jgi:sodium/proline symporter|nr:sodium/proline symporter [Deltaproteobacteria bacterium]MBW2529843.1 sodium/proline symporter [Deltaproteobacteria bacterium]